MKTLRLTFCSRVVTSCSDFTSLNLSSLICLLASPDGNHIERLQDPSCSSWTWDLITNSLCSSKRWGSNPFSWLLSPGFWTPSTPFLWSSWDFSSRTWTLTDSSDSIADLSVFTLFKSNFFQNGPDPVNFLCPQTVSSSAALEWNRNQQQVTSLNSQRCQRRGIWRSKLHEVRKLLQLWRYSTESTKQERTNNTALRNSTILWGERTSEPLETKVTTWSFEAIHDRDNQLLKQ